MTWERIQIQNWKPGCYWTTLLLQSCTELQKHHASGHGRAATWAAAAGISKASVSSSLKWAVGTILTAEQHGDGVVQLTGWTRM